jgi:transmembrane sensor
MPQPTPSGDRTAAAVECFLCLTDPDADPAQRARWTAWLGESPENRAAYHAARESWNRAVPRDVWPTYEEIVNDAYDPEQPIPAARRRGRGAGGAGRGRGERASRGSSLVVVAGVLLLTVILVGLSKYLRPPDAIPEASVYQTGRGEQRRIALTNGSSITLGPLSSLSLAGGPSGRSVHLVSGEALFAITHDPARSFTVFADGGRIDDIGTIFGVAIRAGETTVTVVDGGVSVSSGGGSNVTLQHDQQVSFAQGLSPVVAVDGHSATDWTRGRLAFVDQPLATVVADLARYTTRDVVIADPAAGDLRYTGTIEADAIDQWVAALIRVYPVEADRDGDRVTLRFRPHN